MNPSWTTSTRALTEMPAADERDLGLGLLLGVVDTRNARHGSSPILCPRAEPRCPGRDQRDRTVPRGNGSRPGWGGDRQPLRRAAPRAPVPRSAGRSGGRPGGGSDVRLGRSRAGYEAAGPGLLRGSADGVAGDLRAVQLRIGTRHQLERIGQRPGPAGHPERERELTGREVGRCEDGDLPAELLGQRGRLVPGRCPAGGCRSRHRRGGRPDRRRAAGCAAGRRRPRRASSPAAWPCRSLICLKWSRSSSTTEIGLAALPCGGTDDGQLGVPAAAVGQPGQRVLVAEPLELDQQAAGALLLLLQPDPGRQLAG